MKNHKISKALLDVRLWKDACYREVAHLPFREALRKRIEDCEQRAKKMGFSPMGRSDANRVSAVAEDRSEYGERR